MYHFVQNLMKAPEQLIAQMVDALLAKDIYYLWNKLSCVVVMSMARAKGAVQVTTKTATAREYHLSWDQVDYLFRKFRLQPLAVIRGDRRCKWYRRSDVDRLMHGASLQRAS